MFSDEFDDVDELDEQLLKKQRREQRMRNGQAPPLAAPQNAPEAPQQPAGGAFGARPYSVRQADDNAPRGLPRPDLQGMIDKTLNSIRTENYSRVIQAREARARQHEANLMAMQNDAMLQRLAMEQREREKDRILQRHLATGVRTRELINGRWEDV